MRRRDVLVGAGSLGLSLDAMAAPSGLTPEDLDRAIQRLDRQLDASERGDFATRRSLRRRARTAGRPDEEGEVLERLTRSTLRTLLVADLLSSVSPDEKEHPEVQRLVHDNGAEMDYALMGNMSWLHAMDGETRRQFKATLRSEPEILDGAADEIDALAAEAGINARKRKRLRELVGHVGWRMRNQGPDVLIEEALDQNVRLLSAVGQPPAAALSASSKRRWQNELDRLETTTAAMFAAQADDPPATELRSAKIHDQNDPRFWDAQAKKYRKRAGLTAGLGGISGLAGVLMVGGGFALDSAALIVAGLFPVTGFVVLMIIGLVMLGIAGNKAAKARKLRDR